MKKMQATGFDEKKGRVQNFIIVSQVNQHTFCNFEYVVFDDKMQVGQICKIGQSVKIFDDKFEYMVGDIKDISYHKTFYHTVFGITVVSKSYNADLVPKSRIFQSVDKNVEKITKKINNEFLKIVWSDDFKNKEISDVLIQREISDFAFIRKLAEDRGLFLFLRDEDKKNTKIVVDKFCDSGVVEIKESDIVKFTQIFRQDNVVVCQFKLHLNEEKLNEEKPALYRTGERISLCGREYIITRAEIRYKDDYLEFLYEASDFSQKKQNCENTFSNVLLGLGVVVNTEDPEHLGRIQIDFSKNVTFEDAVTSEDTQKKYIWIPYVTPLSENGGGLVWIPDTGEFVECVYRNGSCVAVGCVRNKSIDEDCRKDNKVSARVLKTRDKRIILVKDDKKNEVEFVGFDNTQVIKLEKNNIVLQHVDGNKKGIFSVNLTNEYFSVNFEDGRKTFFKIQKDSLLESAEKQILLQADRAKLQLEKTPVIKFDAGAKAELNDKKLLIDAGAKVKVESDVTMESNVIIDGKLDVK